MLPKPSRLRGSALPLPANLHRVDDRPPVSLDITSFWSSSRARRHSAQQFKVLTSKRRQYGPVHIRTLLESLQEALLDKLIGGLI